MGDSQQFQVLSFEEIEGIKKELALLATRIDGTKKKLVIETKLRDAAQSINRLQSPTSRDSVGDAFRSSPGRHRRRTLSRGSHDLLVKTDDELSASVRKCEDLAQELWQQEKRSELLHKKLLEHTAGVLQMTHKGTLEKGTGDRTPNVDSGFSSPRDSSQLFNGQHEFDDRSFYSNLDNILDGQHGMINGIASREYEQQTRAILETEQRLENLNRRLRDSIAEAGSQAPNLRGATQQNGASESADATILEHLKDLEQGVSVIQRERDQAMEVSKGTRVEMCEDLEPLSRRVYDLLQRTSQEPGSRHAPPPQADPDDLHAQTDFLNSGLRTIEQDVQRLLANHQALTSRSAGHEDKVDQYDAVLSGLWEILVGAEADARQGENPNERPPPPKEAFSLQAFSSKIQSLFARTTDLREQKDILSRQIQQQRELNSKSDSQKDAQVQNLTRELEQTKALVEDHQERGRALESERQLRKQHEDRYLALENDHMTLRNEHEQARATFNGQMQESDRSVQGLTLRAESLHQERDQAHSQLSELQHALTTKSSELEKAQGNTKDLEGELVRLQTEVTIARAELDGAYGTRAQRAAEVASHPALQSQVDELMTENQNLGQRMQVLQQELSETIGDYEAMTRNSIEYEREREQLENTIDKLRDRCEVIEAELSDEKVRWLGIKSPGSGGGRDSMDKERSTSTGVLKTEFKKMMRETRMDNLRALKVRKGWTSLPFTTDLTTQFEQEERRKLEALVRSMKKDQTPGKSGLSQSMTAS